MVKIHEDWDEYQLRTMNLKNVGEIFQLSIRDVHVDPQQEYRNNSL